MANAGVETSRIHDGVRDSKILRDTPSQLSQKSASLGAEADRVVTGLRHYPTHDCNQVRRDVPRVSAVDVGDEFQYRNCNVEEENKRYFRSNLHTYSGTPIIEDFWEWIDAIENYFEETKPPDKLQCKLASYTLIEEAEGWWYQLQHRRLFQGKLKIDSWNRMKHLLAKRFLPQNCSTKFSLQHISYSPMFLPLEYVQDGLKYEGNVANISNSKRSSSVVDIKKGKGNEVLKHLMAGSIMPNKCSTKLPNDWQGKIGQCLEELEVVICGPDEGDYLVTEEIEEYDDIEDNDAMYEGLVFLFTSEIENGEQLKQKAIENPMPTTCLIECSKEIKEGIASDFVSMKCPSKLEIIEQEGMVVAHNLVAVNALLKNVVGANDAEKLKGIVAVQKSIDNTNLGWTLMIKVGSFASFVNTTGDMVVFSFDPGGLMVDGLVEKFSSKVFLVGNETGGVAKDGNAKEERSQRRLLYESDFMNGRVVVMNFDPGGKSQYKPKTGESDTTQKSVNYPLSNYCILFSEFVCRYYNDAKMLENLHLSPELLKGLYTILKFAKLVWRFVPNSVDAYLTPFIKEFLYGFLSQFGEHKTQLVKVMSCEWLINICYVDDFVNRGFMSTNRIFDPGVVMTEPLSRNRELNLLIVVLFAADNFSPRMAIRRTWVQDKSVGPGPVALWYIIVLHENRVVNDGLWNEVRVYGHIQLVPFVVYISCIAWRNLGVCNYGTDVICKQSDTPDPIINASHGFYCYYFYVNNAHKPNIWNKAWGGWSSEDMAFVVASQYDELNEEMGDSHSNEMACGILTRKYIFTKVKKELNEHCVFLGVVDVIGPEILESKLSHHLSNLIPGKVWIDIDNNSIMAKLSTLTISSCLSILGYKGYFKKALKLFHNVVNGLDPPMDVVNGLDPPKGFMASFGDATSVSNAPSDQEQLEDEFLFVWGEMEMM